MVRRSSTTSRGTTYWFQFLFSCVPGISSVHAHVFRTAVLINVIKKMRKTKNSIPVFTQLFVSVDETSMSRSCKSARV